METTLAVLVGPYDDWLGLVDSSYKQTHYSLIGIGNSQPEAYSTIHP
jgi:hypothetical protein